MKHWIEQLLAKPLVAHALSANERYHKRLGPQFAGAVTYFSVLSMVPILMFSFAALGMLLTVLRPDLLGEIKTFIDTQLGQGDLARRVSQVIDRAFENWRSVGVIAFLTAAYSGSNWVGNLKRAVRVMWSEKFVDATVRKNFFLELLLNLLLFCGLLLCIVLGIGVAQIGSAFSQQVISWLGWQHVPGIGIFWQVLTIALTFLASWILFAFLFTVLPNQAANPRAWLGGTLIGAIAVTVLQSVAGRLIGLFAGNLSAAIFGPVIVMMLVFNLLATIILMTAAWVGTDQVWSRNDDQKVVEPPQPEQEELVMVPNRRVAAHTMDELRSSDTPLPAADRDKYLREDVAARGMSTNLKIGYGIGTATGLGLGALVTWAARKLVLLIKRRK